MSNVLFLTDIAPVGNQTAGRILENIAKKLVAPGIDFYSIVVANPELIYDMRSTEFDNQIFWVQKPLEDWSKIKIFSKIGEVLTDFESKKISLKIQTVLDDIKPDLIILVLQCQTIIKIASELDLTKYPVISLVWDDWSWWERAHSIPDSASKRIVSKRNKLLEKSELVLLPSDEMCRDFLDIVSSNKLGTLYPLVDYTNLQSRPSKGARESQVFTIGFAGQYYAEQEINDLIQAVRSFNAMGDVQIKFRLHSRNPNVFNDEFIENVGFLPRKELIDSLSECDLLFLPYPFDQFFRKIVKTSFPSKIADYCSTDIPIFYYGPGDSAICYLLNKLEHQLILDQPSQGNILNYLVYLFSDNFDVSSLNTTNEVLRRVYFSDSQYRAISKLYLDNSHSKSRSENKTQSFIFYWYRRSLSRAIYKRMRKLYLRVFFIFRIYNGIRSLFRKGHRLALQRMRNKLLSDSSLGKFDSGKKEPIEDFLKSLSEKWI